MDPHGFSAIWIYSKSALKAIILFLAFAAGFPSAASLYPRCRFKHLDLHARVTGEEEKFSNELDTVYSDVKEIEGFGYFDTHWSQEKMQVRQHQTGVLRTNCFDSLDRTNLLQYQVTWRWLQNYIQQQPQLKGFLPAMSPTGYSKGMAFFDMMSDAQVSLQGLLRNLWADLGDALSQQYTGAASTMGATLRQGGHTTRAMLEKGWQAMNRAYMAHFEDTARQAALQLLLKPQKLSKVPMATPELKRSPQGKLLVATCSWNLHGRRCWDEADVLQGLIRGACRVNGDNGVTCQRPDLFVFCFQEFAELSASNVVLKATGDEVNEAHFEKMAAKALEDVFQQSFWPVRSVGMVGLLVSVFVASPLGPSIKCVAGERVRSGLYGQAGNKAFPACCGGRCER
eukprot:symbB.v1.2.010337.t1/scaffold671.1/size323421/18